jgi:hypothetical protein
MSLYNLKQDDEVTNKLDERMVKIKLEKNEESLKKSTEEEKNEGSTGQKRHKRKRKPKKLLAKVKLDTVLWSTDKTVPRILSFSSQLYFFNVYHCYQILIQSQNS